MSPFDGLSNRTANALFAQMRGSPEFNGKLDVEWRWPMNAKKLTLDISKQQVIDYVKTLTCKDLYQIPNMGKVSIRELLIWLGEPL